MIQDLYFNISEMKLSIKSLYIIYDAPKYDIIWTENSDVMEVGKVSKHITSNWLLLKMETALDGLIKSAQTQPSV